MTKEWVKRGELPSQDDEWKALALVGPCSGVVANAGRRGGVIH